MSFNFHWRTFQWWWWWWWRWWHSLASSLVHFTSSVERPKIMEVFWFRQTFLMTTTSFLTEFRPTILCSRRCLVSQAQGSFKRESKLLLTLNFFKFSIIFWFELNEPKMIFLFNPFAWPWQNFAPSFYESTSFLRLLKNPKFCETFEGQAIPILDLCVQPIFPWG